jgi:hypothetical protein
MGIRLAFPSRDSLRPVRCRSRPLGADALEWACPRSLGEGRTVGIVGCERRARAAGLDLDLDPL